MACRQTGFAMLCSASVQEAHDFAAIAHAATLRTRVPFLHFFDGFRTSHELAQVELLADRDLAALLSDEEMHAFRRRALTPDRPVLRGTAQNPDAFFQAREAINPFYDDCAGIVSETMQRFGELTGRTYRPFEYVGHPEAERVLVVMGSGAETVEATIEHLTARGERVGAVKVRLFRPFGAAEFARSLPASTRSLGVLDRTKEPGAVGEPLYQDVVTALAEARLQGASDLASDARVIGGRYGLSSKEFTPGMVRAVLDEIGSDRPQNHFTVGIVDDVTHRSLSFDADVDIEGEDVVRALFYGLGSDGTVGANKNTIKIISEQTKQHAQGYFVYDSKKAGAVTVSHLRFGPDPIHAPYLIRRADFVGCHQFSFLDRIDVLEHCREGGVFLLNSPYPAENVWEHLPREVQESIVDKKLRFFVVDAYALAREVGVGPRINTIMQACFFALCDVLPLEAALEHIREAVAGTYGKKGPEIVRRNVAAVDQAVSHLHEVDVPGEATTERYRPPVVSEQAPEFVQRVTAVLMAGKGDQLPVSAFPVDGTWPTGTAGWEKRNLAHEIPVWDTELCIQCNKCVLSCPHAAIRAKAYPPSVVEGAPPTFKSTEFRSKEPPDHAYTLQVAPEDCTGCTLCVQVCPAKDKANPRRKAIAMSPQQPLRDAERANYDFFLGIPELDRTALRLDVKSTQMMEPLFEYSGACSGCGETPYVKLLTQLFGDRLLIANATGCSSIYGGNLPTTPYTTNADGRGPAWSNSLFEDNAEFGYGMRLAVDYRRDQARALVEELADSIGADLSAGLLEADQSDEAGIAEQRRRVEQLRENVGRLEGSDATTLAEIADYLVDKSVWLVGGDGWAYDIGYGGLDHVLASGRNVNVLVLDTEVYSNTGGQQSKATPMAAAAKFAAAGKEMKKKDLGRIAMSYEGVYVASVAWGANDAHTVKALVEAERHPGPSLVIAYSHCIAHGYDLAFGQKQQKLAVDSGVWPLYRYDPERGANGEPPLHLDCKKPKIRPAEYLRGEMRFRIAQKIDPKRFARLIRAAERDAADRFALYEQLAGIRVTVPADPDTKSNT